MRYLILTAILLSAIPARAGAPPQHSIRPIHTYSIVSRDPETGLLGVAVQSHWFSVGSVVTWAEPGVGAVATQSLANPAYGPRGLDLMRSGLDAGEALHALLTADEGAAVRQVAFIDNNGNVAAHTGAKCIESASHITGDGYSVQANLMANDRIVPAMAAAFEESDGDLAERMMAALEAAQREGGDIRGKQSAAMLIVAPRNTGKPWVDRVLELRIEDHPTPIVELRRLLTIHRGYEEMNRGDLALETGDFKKARDHYKEATRLIPGNPEVMFWHAVTLATSGGAKESIPIFAELFAVDSTWRETLRRLQKPEIIPNDDEGTALIEQILEQTR